MVSIKFSSYSYDEIKSCIFWMSSFAFAIQEHMSKVKVTSESLAVAHLIPDDVHGIQVSFSWVSNKAFHNTYFVSNFHVKALFWWCLFNKKVPHRISFENASFYS